MAVLDNIKHERFARFLFEGIDPRSAYVKAGYKPNNGNAYTLKEDQRIRARLTEMETDAARAAALDKSYVLAGLIDIYEKSSVKIPVLDREGKPTGEYRYDSAGAVRALELLGKHLKMFTDKIDLRTIKFLDDLTEEEMDALAEDLKAKTQATERDLEETGVGNC